MKIAITFEMKNDKGTIYSLKNTFSSSKIEIKELNDEKVEVYIFKNRFYSLDSIYETLNDFYNDYIIDEAWENEK